MVLALPNSLDFSFLTVHLVCWNVRDVFQNTTGKFLRNIQFICLTTWLYCSSKLPQVLRLNVLKTFFSPVWLSSCSEERCVMQSWRWIPKGVLRDKCKNILTSKGTSSTQLGKHCSQVGPCSGALSLYASLFWSIRISTVPHIMVVTA